MDQELLGRKCCEEKLASGDAYSVEKIEPNENVEEVNAKSEPLEKNDEPRNLEPTICGQCIQSSKLYPNEAASESIEAKDSLQKTNSSNQVCVDQQHHVDKQDSDTEGNSVWEDCNEQTHVQCSDQETAEQEVTVVVDLPQIEERPSVSTQTSVDLVTDLVDSQSSSVDEDNLVVNGSKPHLADKEVYGDESTVQYSKAEPIIIYDLPPLVQNLNQSQAASPPLTHTPGSNASDVVSFSSKMVCLMPLATMLTCPACYVCPLTSLTVHTCKYGHQVCGHCFGTGQRVCPLCWKPLVGRHEPLERFLERLRQLCPELFVTENLTMTFSHRPIQCPHLTCRRTVTSNQRLVKHFKVEHPSVKRYNMHYSHLLQRLSMPALCLDDTSPRAIALFEIVVKQAEKIEDCEVVVCLVFSAAFAEYSMVAVWCAAQYEKEAPFTYRLQAETSTGGELSITGDVISLHSLQKTKYILDSSHCLVLSMQDFAQQCALNNQVPISVSFTPT